MATAVKGAKPAADRQWYIVERWQEFEGEGRTNLLRIVAIGVFYLVELAQYHWLTPAGADAAELASYHQKVTALAVAWTMVSLAVMLCLRMRVFPAILKYASTGCDLLLLTALASVDHGAKNAAPDGPASPMVLIFFSDSGSGCSPGEHRARLVCNFGLDGGVFSSGGARGQKMVRPGAHHSHGDAGDHRAEPGPNGNCAGAGCAAVPVAGGRIFHAHGTIYGKIVHESGHFLSQSAMLGLRSVNF